MIPRYWTVHTHLKSTELSTDFVTVPVPEHVLLEDVRRAA